MLRKCLIILFFNLSIALMMMVVFNIPKSFYIGWLVAFMLLLSQFALTNQVRSPQAVMRHMMLFVIVKMILYATITVLLIVYTDIKMAWYLAAYLYCAALVSGSAALSHQLRSSWFS